MNVPEILHQSAERCPEKIALIHKKERFTYREIQERVNQLSASLQEEGVQKGDRVAIMLRNNPLTVISYFAILQIGAVEVAMNIMADSSEYLIAKLNDCGAKALITNRKHLGFLTPEKESLVSLKSIYVDGELSGEDYSPHKSISVNSLFESERKIVQPVEISSEDLASIAYSSGTTGSPKGIMLSHSNLFSVAEVTTKDLDDENEICLMLIPLYHTFAKQILNSRFMKGVTIVLIENIAFPEIILDTINKEKVTGIIGVPTIYKMILNRLNVQTDFQAESLKYLSTGGSKMPRYRILELWEKFPSIMIISGYGLTETCGRGTFLTMEKKDQERKIVDSCGRAPFEMKLVTKEGQACQVGEIGQVLFKGPNVMMGYWQKPEETDAVLKEGWLYSGDLGMIDEEGYLYLIGREKDIIKTGGELISPAEIEKVIERCESVKEAAVIGIPDELLGERLKMYVVLEPKETMTEGQVKEYCARVLPPIKVPSVVEFCDSLPRSTLDKVKKSELREMNS